MEHCLWKSGWPGRDFSRVFSRDRQPYSPLHRMGILGWEEIFFFMLESSDFFGRKKSQLNPLGTWRIIPFSKLLVTPIYKPFRPFGRGPTTPLRGLTITMVINHLLTGMILQVAPPFPLCVFFWQDYSMQFGYWIPLGTSNLQTQRFAKVPKSWRKTVIGSAPY